MNDTTYDILILGGGPIGASTAYFLTQGGTSKKIGLITQEPTEDHSATYLYAGGSVRWFWDDPDKASATKRTADFIKQLLAEGVDLSAIEDHYLFLHRGVYVPSLNVSGAKLVGHLLQKAQDSGLTVHNGQRIKSVEAGNDGITVTTDLGSFKAAKVLLALGITNNQFMPGLNLEPEKRQLFVLDTAIDDTRTDFPHIIAKIGDGVVYAFIKKTAQGLRLLVGQEDMVEAGEEPGPEDYFQKLLDAGVGELMPFLANAKVENILWGIDVANKTLRLETKDGLFSANCGSAVRSCIAIGQEVAHMLTK